MLWLVLAACAVGVAVLMWRSWLKISARKQAEEQRLAAFMAETMKAPRHDAAPALPAPVAAPAVPAPAGEDTLPIEKKLIEAAIKASEAGEPAIAAALYRRLLERFPHSPLADFARTRIKG